jgi:hypothetical protein
MFQWVQKYIDNTYPGMTMDEFKKIHAFTFETNDKMISFLGNESIQFAYPTLAEYENSHVLTSSATRLNMLPSEKEQVIAKIKEASYAKMLIAYKDMEDNSHKGSEFLQATIEDEYLKKQADIFKKEREAIAYTHLVYGLATSMLKSNLGIA